QGEPPRRLGEIVARAPSPFHRLELPDEDPVDALADGLVRREIRHAGQALPRPHPPHPASAHADEAVLSRQLVVCDRPFHAEILSRSRRGEQRRLPTPPPRPVCGSAPSSPAAAPRACPPPRAARPVTPAGDSA